LGRLLEGGDEVLTRHRYVVASGGRDALPVGRFVTHLRYLFHRQQHPSTVPGEVDSVLDAIRLSHPREHVCAVRLAELLRERFGWDIGDEEVLFLTLHVARMTSEARSSPSASAPPPDTET
jgi:beta-glucoside operon transcriptional antiterminator